MSGNNKPDETTRPDATYAYAAAPPPRQDHKAPVGIAATLQQAVAWHRQGRLAQAEALYRKILELQPGHFDALHMLGVVCQQSGNPHAAIELIGRAININPGNADAHSNLGNALLDLGRYEDALSCYNNALNIKPDHVEPLYNRGLALQELRRYDEALASYERALSLKPDHARALSNRGIALRDLKRHQDAIVSFSRLVEIAPDFGYALGNLCFSRLQCCDWSGYHESVERIAKAVSEGKRVIDPFSFTAISQSAAMQLQCARTYAADRYPPSQSPLWSGRRHNHDKLRIAYLSADFYNHATAYLMAGLFEQHDRERFEITAISFGPDARDGMRERLTRAFHQFVDIRGKSDREAAMLLHDMEIDIVVDLKGYTQGNRTGILAHRAAPIQVNYLGYPGTMGANYVDYILADARLIPPEHRAYYSERVVCLPDSYQVNDATRRIAEGTFSRADAGLPQKGFVFCSFNNNYKITPDVFDVWMRLLRNVPGSVLWLLEDSPVASHNLRQEAGQRDVAPQRLVFAPRMALDEHLARHRLADLFLDTLPINAHTTASDALWAGLPVLTCMGETFAGRVAASVLGALDMPELITRNLEDYEALAFALATTPDMLGGIRNKLARNRTSRPLFDTDRFRRHIEFAYLTMWERFQRGEQPASFDVHAELEP